MTDASQQNWLAQYEANRARLIDGLNAPINRKRDAKASPCHAKSADLPDT